MSWCRHDCLAGSFRRLANHLSPKVLHRILEFDFLGDRDTPIADNLPAELLLDQDTLRFGPRVTRTASARMFASFKMLWRA
jgi:hypothetical protein